MLTLPALRLERKPVHRLNRRVTSSLSHRALLHLDLLHRRHLGQMPHGLTSHSVRHSHLFLACLMFPLNYHPPSTTDPSKLKPGTSVGSSPAPPSRTVRLARPHADLGPAASGRPAGLPRDTRASSAGTTPPDTSAGRAAVSLRGCSTLTQHYWTHERAAEPPVPRSAPSPSPDCSAYRPAFYSCPRSPSPRGDSPFMARQETCLLQLPPVTLAAKNSPSMARQETCLLQLPPATLAAKNSPSMARQEGLGHKTAVSVLWPLPLYRAVSAFHTHQTSVGRNACSTTRSSSSSSSSPDKTAPQREPCPWMGQ